jgi:hypothetical protein
VVRPAALKGTVLEEGVATLPVEEAPALELGAEVWATRPVEAGLLAGLLATRVMEEEQAALQTLTVLVA